MPLSHQVHPSVHFLITALIAEETTDVGRQEAFEALVQIPLSAEMLTEGAKVLRSKMVPTELSPENAIDTCGTGGSGKKTLNTSTLTALIVAAAGGKVAKHGNRSASGNCGCFDLLEKLDVKINLNPEQEKRIFDELGIVFLFAPLHHPALRFVAPLRKQYGKKTVFNMIGPLCNPAGVKHQMIGTGSDDQAVMVAKALESLGTAHSLVVRGHDGLDEVTITDDTTIYDVRPRGVTRTTFSPKTFGIPPAQDVDIEGGDPEQNARIFMELIRGGGTDAQRNLVIVNAAHALLLTSLFHNLQEAIDQAREIVLSGKAFDIFAKYKNMTAAL